MLATCEEHGLDYVTDETNFQPEITLRNAVRHALTVGNTSDVSVFLIRAPFPMLIQNRIYIVIERYKKWSRMQDASEFLSRFPIGSKPFGR